MRVMDLQALYPRRRTSQPGKGHTIYPYLLRELSIERADQVWATDITYIPPDAVYYEQANRQLAA